jgi:DNA-binding NarL/FixJ family response regulator
MPDPKARRSTPIRVAVLDEHRLVGEALSVALQNHRMNVVLAASSWEELSSLPDPVHVAVIALHLDDGVLIRTKTHVLANRGTATVVVSARSDVSAMALALRAGALAFVAKTDSLDDLVAAIHAAASGGTHLPPGGASAIAEAELAPDPGLGRQEERALVLYARGRSIREVAADMNTTEETIKSYIKRGRRKFRDVGVDIGTRILLRRHAVKEGWFGSD